MYDKYLPIGTVVLLKDATKKLMIIGFCSTSAEDKSKIYDYSGCLYPEGLIDSKEVALFNHDQISKLYFMGYQNDEEIQFKANLKELIEKKQK